MFVFELFIGGVLICVNVAIHALSLDFLAAVIDRWSNQARLVFKRHWKVPLLMATSLGVFSAHIVQIWIWAIFYISVGALHDLETALYFSTVTFTTVGFGDVVIGPDWRLVSSFEAANGFLLFGWSTAFIFEIMSRLYEREG